MRLDALDHPKTLDFASRLNVTRPTAIGHLELLWAFTGKMAPQGNIGKWPIGAIARACDWMGEPMTFIRALVDAGFVDENAEAKLLIHDWHDHAPRWVKAKLKNLCVGFFSTTASTTDDTTDEENATVVATIGPTLDPVLQGKGREGKGRESVPPLTLVPPAVVPKHKPRRSTQAPEDFRPDLAYARAAIPDIDAEKEAEKFRDWEFKTARSNWPAVWRNWIRNCVESGKYARNGKASGGTSGLPTLNFG